ncbi:MAG: dTDP-4-dehydrorhamnose 3,5-epimerase [Desulfovibrionaceae bacterium]
MEIEHAPLAGVMLLKPKIWGDARGYFVETWQHKRYTAAGITLPFVQDNHSCSTYGILRGLHFQRHHPQGKLVYVSLGNVFDVVVDIRHGSPTFGQWFGAELSAENQYQMWIPPGMAHGFAVTSPTAHFHYKCTDYYQPNDEGSIRWDDPTIGICWPLIDPVLSAKDQKAPYLRDAVSPSPADKLL